MDSLLDLQKAIADELKGRGLIKQIPVITEDVGDLENLVTERAAQLGACIVVQTGVGDVEAPNVPGPELKTRITIHVFENVGVNRAEAGTRLPALRIAEEVLRALHLWAPPGGQPLYGAPHDALILPERSPLVRYEVTLYTVFQNEPDSDPRRFA